MWKKISLVLCVSINVHAAAQNLVVDGGFEEMTEFGCQNSPIEAFWLLAHWKTIWAPYLHTRGCSYSDVDWWKSGGEPKEGLNYANLQGALMKGGRFGGHNVGTALTESLNIGRLYQFEMYYRPRGVRQRPQHILEYCLSEPRKHIYLYFMEEQLVEEDDFYENATPVLRLTNEALNAAEATSEWLAYSDCFEANVAAKHLAVSLDRGNFEILPPCEIDTTDIFNTFHHYHVDVDQISLHAFPLEVDTSLGLCTETSLVLNLYELTNTPIKEGINFIWSDDYEGAERTITEAAEYEITAQLDCGSFPIRLNIISLDCDNNFYVPTAFSPNDDGKNDYFQVFLNSEPSISDYQLSLFDRWGNLIFQSTTPDDRWDGNIKNRAAVSGLYIWSIQFNILLPEGQKLVNKSGSFHLLR
ncbi:MAG: gliding motility-associated C-terminal domain-containing protein [Bacteroidota bacterium]